MPNGYMEYLRFALPIKNVLTHLRFIGIELFGYTRDKLFNLLAIFGILTCSVLQTKTDQNGDIHLFQMSVSVLCVIIVKKPIQLSIEVYV